MFDIILTWNKFNMEYIYIKRMKEISNYQTGNYFYNG